MATYDAFISYVGVKDKPIAAALQSLIQRLSAFSVAGQASAIAERLVSSRLAWREDGRVRHAESVVFDLMQPARTGRRVGRGHGLA
jgi:hypothetical protein